MTRSELSTSKFKWSAPGLVVAAAVLGLGFGSPPAHAQPNPIVTENALPGNPSSEWDVSGAGDASIQGFATDLSVDQGDTVYFKIDTDATDYRLDIYRMGYYGGDGARLVATEEPSATLPQIQPACTYVDSTKLLDCGTWDVSASWAVPDTATSGIYLAKLVREDPEDGRSSHIVFIVRDDDGGSALLFKTSDATWQAYNRYGDGDLFGGASLYTGPSGKADKVSYNRPFTTRGVPTEDWVMNATYPMVRWLERNGYDVSYFTDIDADRYGSEILEHPVFLSVGHDEYWSRAQREAVEAARAAGIHLGFFSGNEVYWKTRWEESVDGSGTPYRTLVCYKEGSLGESQCGFKCDPDSTVWTGLWRSGCSYTPPADGCEPENALSGQISWVGSTGSIQVPYAYKDLPIWRNTSITALLPESPPATFPYGTLGYEWDFEQYEEYYPPGRIKMSETNLGGRVHHLSLYRHGSGALVFGAGTVQWSWGLDSNHDRGSEPEDVRMQQATVNILGDMGVDPETLQGNLVLASPSSDTTPPTSAITFPTSGSNVESGSLITITGTASDSGAVALVEVSVDGGSTWFAATGTDIWSYGWTPGAPGSATLMSRATDGSLNTETPGPGVTVTIDPRVCPCGIWSLSAVPDNVDNVDTNAIEVGLRFQSDLNGYVTGARFYKTVNNTGSHIGNLWSNTGTNLGSVVFSGESASGWQEAVFSSPIAITADTTYVISYHSTTGYYALDEYYFTPSGVSNPPLRALADGEDGANGVYTYSGTSTFPTNTWHSANYWVDVVFSESAVDTLPPVVQSRTPSSGAFGVSVNSVVSAVFNEAVVESTITFELRDSLSVLVPAVFSYDSPTRTATLTPSGNLDYSATYTATVSGAEDLSGNAMATPDVWSFTTGSPPPPPPDEGPGGPILVIGDAANPFGRYFAEILRAEGLNYFSATDISLVTPTTLMDHDVVILGEMSLSAGDVTMFTDWVTAGGKLIAMRPDKQLVSLLGLTDAASTLAEGYLLLDTASGPGVGLVDQTIQFHGTADLYTLNGAASLATLYSDATTATSNPAITLNSVGGNGGQAAAFTFDLARSVVYTRQGNPAWEGQERDGTAPLRADDMFYGAAAGDPQPDWIDLNKVAIPQADEQQRFLAKLIAQMETFPMPRFWYFPSGHKAVVVMTGDHHGCCGGTTGRWDIYLGNDPPGCSVDDWECIRGSSYIYPGSGLTDAQALYYHNLGFELGIHVNTGCANWTPIQLETFYTNQLATFTSQFPSLPRQGSERTHCISWADWVTQAKVKVLNGIRLDTNYYFWPPGWVANRPGMFTGSGMPMRFADLDGTMIDVYQVTTQMTDESNQTYPYTIDTLLDRALGTEAYYGAFCANMHTDNAVHGGSAAIVASALARGVPVVSGRQMLVWLDGRNSSSFDSLAWNGTLLSFDLTAGTGSRNMQGMIPVATPTGTLTGITLDSVPLAYTTEFVKGVEYAFFDADPGSYEAAFAPDTDPPVLSSTDPVDTATDVPVDTDITLTYDEAVNPATFNASISGGVTFVTAFSAGNTVVTLDPDTDLSYSTAYTVTVDPGVEDVLGNPTVSSATVDFTTAAPPPLCLIDETLGDFTLGAFDSGIYLSGNADGEVVLAPTVGAEFDSTALPAGWGSVNWDPAGSTVVSGGLVTVDAARIRTDGLYTAGVSLEFNAIFAAGAGNAYQHGGFAGGGDTAPETYNSAPWAMFSTGSTGADIQARVWDGGTQFDTSLPGSYLGAAHRYRIDWGATVIDFYVDDVLVHTETITITAGNMRPAFSDLNPAGAAFSVDWMRLSPYAVSGSFTSRVLDAGETVDWHQATWTSAEPAGTSLSLFVRTGNTPAPGPAWTAFAPIAASGDSVGGSGRYAQYRADLGTADPNETPVIEDVQVCYSVPASDVVPPEVRTVTPGSGETDVAVSADVTAVFSETLDPLTLDDTSFTLTPQGGGPAVAATMTYNAGTLTGTLDPASNLAGGTVYDARITVAVTDVAGNPMASEFLWSFTTTAPDVTPPAVASTDPAASASDVPVAGDITATFTEDMNPATINATTFTLTPQGGGPAVTAVVTYDGGLFTATLNPDVNLDYGTAYEARVTTGAEDLAGNPLASDHVWTFATEVLAGVCAEDQTLADFTAGTPDAGIYLSETADGEVILSPTEGSEFGGASLPAGWTSGQWTGGVGTTVVGGGVVTVDGTRIQTSATYGAGRSLEFTATFNGGANQHVGFSDDFSSRWVIFSGKTSADRLYARVNPGGTDIDLGTGYVGAPHRYRIQWNAGATHTLDFYIDGSLVNSQTVAALGVMSPIASDFAPGDGALVVDWMRMSDYTSPGSFTSRVFDAGSASIWGDATWTETLPPGTALAIYARTGNVSVPDGSWTAFTQVPSSGSSVDSTGQYIQYRADLSTTDPTQTPVLADIAFECTATGPDVTPPVISGLTATPGPGGTTATVDWTTNENADSRVDYGTDPGALVLSVSNPADETVHSLGLTGLLPGTTYYYRATSADPSDNSATEPVGPPASFTTPQQPCAVDMVAADFAAGTLSDVRVSETGDGEVILLPLDGSEFSGASLPPGWSSTPWSGGTVTVSGGSATADGARANPSAVYSPGRSLEFVATFGAQSFQSIGFGLTFNESLWGMFGTRTSASNLYATTHDGTTLTDVSLGGSYLGAPHLYRIDWNPTSIDFYIDGGLVHSQAVTIATDMRPIISDYTNGGAVVTVDWLRMTPYTSSGSFDSRVFDGGGPTTWGEVSWNAVLPAGTTLDMSVATGDVPVPDGSWTTTPVATSGTNLGIQSRYIQYQAVLGTSDTEVTPSLEDVGITCAPAGSANTVAAVASGVYLSNASPCATIPIVITRTDLTGLKTASVTFGLSSELAFCTGNPGAGFDVREGSYLSSVSPTSFSVQNNGNGTYTAETSLLGAPCGATDSTGTLFEVDMTSTVSDGSGTVTVTSVILLDCSDAQIASATGPAAVIPIDHTPPAALAGMNVVQVKNGSPAGSTPGTTAITLDWTPAEPGATVIAYRKGFGDYPEYDDGTGGTPAAPPDTTAATSAGWGEVGTTGSSSMADAPDTRDFWYYVAFVADSTGNLSPVSGPPVGALNYHLGDVSDGVTPGTGDQVVDLFDVSTLGDAYGTGDGDLEYENYLDVGPTTDQSADALPTTDDLIQFEDLILFAVNFEPAGAPAPGVLPTTAATRNELALYSPPVPGAGETFEVVLVVASDGRLQGVSVPLTWDKAVVEPVGIQAGSWIRDQPGLPLVLSPEPGTVDAVLLGTTLSGEGELATVTFRVVGEGDPGIQLGEILGRDAANRPVELAGRVLTKDPSPPVIPALTRLLPVAPNPFASGASIFFDLADEGPVSIQIFNVSGRLVSNFVDSRLPAGRYQRQWAGTDDGGRGVPAGLYLIRMVTPGHVQTQRVVRLR